MESGKTASPGAVSPAPSAVVQNDGPKPPPAAVYAGFEAGGGYRVRMQHGVDPVTDSASLEIDFVRGHIVEPEIDGTYELIRVPSPDSNR